LPGCGVPRDLLFEDSLRLVDLRILREVNVDRDQHHARVVGTTVLGAAAILEPHAPIGAYNSWIFARSVTACALPATQPPEPE
jgi:hypothetical protein